MLSKISIPILLEFEDYSIVDQNYKDFLDKINGIISRDKILLMGEFYNNQITKLENGFNQAFNKCLAYVALIAFIAPFFLSFIMTQKINYFYLVILLIVFFYLLGNIFVLIMNFIKVKSYNFILESEIHKHSSMDRAKTIINFHTYKVLKKKSDYHISIIRNIERYIKLFATVTFGSWIILYFYQSIQFSYMEEFEEKVVNRNYEYFNIELKGDSKYSFTSNNKEELIKLEQEHINNATDIIVFYSDKSIEELNQSFKSYLQLSLTKSTNIIFIEDLELENGNYKILIKGEK